MTVDTWLAAALADADRRGLPDVKPLLEGLARATRALRAADFNQSPLTPETSGAIDASGSTSGRPAS